ncbi:MAG: protein-disulfide reductase DsbD family protein [Fidelibacterota bacterium]
MFVKHLYFTLLFSIVFGAGELSDEMNCLNFNITTTPSKVYPEETVTVNFNIQIEKGYHIYAAHPDLSLSPTSISYNDTSLFDIIGIISEPTPQKKYDGNFDMIIGYHEGKFNLSQQIRISSEADAGEFPITGTLKYLACDASKCIPHWDDFVFQLSISNGNPREEFIIPVQSEYDLVNVPDEEKSTDKMGSFDDAIQKGLLSFILLAFSMGFLALLTPCVFPMIPITVSYFTKQGEHTGSRPIRDASIYTIGIILIFTFFGLILAVTLGATGANQLASNPWVNLFITLLFVVFALSLFGHFEIQLPSKLRQFSVEQENRGGITGIIFMAFTFTITSFTCTVQFVGLLLVAASKGSFLWPIIGLLSFSAAFASPFFFLALFPEYLVRLPKSGGWLNSVKVTMGFLELGAAMKFISNVDLVWQWGIFTNQVVLSVWIVLSFMMGFYLLGKIKLPHDSDIDRIGVPRLMLSIIFISFGLYLSGGLFGRPLHGLIDSYLPPVVDASRENIVIESSEESFEWIDSLDDGLIIAAKENKPVFIDFTGYTCTNCRWMETNVFEDIRVSRKFNDFVLVRLFTDGGKNHRENQRLEVERFGTAALPFYVILSPDNNEIARFHGMDTDVGKFLEFLEKGTVNL